MSDYEFWSLPGDDLLGGDFLHEKLDRKLRRQLLGAHICFGGGKGGGGSSAPAPDKNIGIAALKQAETGQQWLEFAKEQFEVGNKRQEGIDELSKKVTDTQLASMEQANKWAQQNNDSGWTVWDESRQNANAARETGKQYEKRFLDQADKQYAFADEQQQRYKNTFQPIEDRIAKDAMNWDSAERQAEMAAQARGDVVNNAAMAQQQQNRQMAAMGVDPRSGRYNATNRALGLNTALLSAGAQNSARDTVRNQAQQLRGGAASIGQQVNQNAQQANSMGLQATNAGHSANVTGQQLLMQFQNQGLAARGIGNSSATLATGGSLGSSALGSALGANSAWQGNNAIMGQGFQGAMNGYAGQANTLNGLYGNQLSGWQTQQQASSANAAGLMSGIGTMAGLGIAAFSSKDYKEDKRPINGALDAVNSMPVERWKYKDGISDGGEHIGPYAEDFQKATGAGDGKTINLVDGMGITMKAVQELSEKVDKLAGSKGIGIKREARA